MIKLFNKQALTIAVLSFSMAVPVVMAQDLAQEQKTLADTQARIVALGSEQKTAAQQLGKLKAERASIARSIEPATQEFEAVKAERDSAVTEAKANPSETTQKIADNANFKFMLAERKYNKSKDALDAHDAKAAELEKRVASNAAAIKAAQTGIEQQKTSIAQLQKQSSDNAKLAAAAAAKKKEQELQLNKAALADTQAKAAAAQAEIENLKKMLADKQAQEAAAKVAAVPVTATPAAPAAAAVAVPVATTSAAAPAAATKPSQDFKAIHAAFEQRKTLVNTRFIRGLSSKIVYIKSMVGGKEASKATVSLPPQTPDLFQGDAVLPAGDIDVVMGLQTWKQTISPSDAGKKFIINIDTKGGKPELVMYPEAALK
jgi:hypothetical protein